MKQTAKEQYSLMKQTAKENSEQTDKLITEVNKIASAANEDLKQSKRALDASIEMARRDQRAWVEIEPIKPIPFAKADGNFGASFQYEIYLKNVGKTVARDIVMHASRMDSGLALGDNADQIRRAQKILLHENLGDNNRMIKVLAPNTVSPVPLRLRAQEPQIFKSGNAFYSFLIGRIDYVDAFSVKHWMTFCYIISNSRGELLNSKEGNDEDNNPETTEH
jgi:hypothetical protein